MAIDLLSEQLIPLNQAPKHTPGRPHVNTIYRWISRRRDPLETVRVGGRRYTSVEAIRRFISRCTSPDTLLPPSPSAARQRQIEAAERHLREEGVLP